MSNYVHNYLFCNETAKERMMNLDDNDYSLLSGCYDITVTPISNNRFLVIFDTRGMKYSEEFIVRYIQEYKDTKWYCIEENEVEQGFYFWDGTKVELKKRKLVEVLGRKEICIGYDDCEYRPFRSIFISDDVIVFENLLENEMKKFSFSDKAKIKINNYINSLLAEKSGKSDPVPIKEGIGRGINIHWGNQTYYIDYIDEDDDREWNVEEGEKRFESITSFFNTILLDEGINENVLFDLKDL